VIDDAPAPHCVICPRQLLDHEAGRYICTPCEHRIDADLRKEVYKIRAQAEAIISGERKPRVIPVACGCGTVTGVTLNTDGFTCRGCKQEYGHSEALQLTPVRNAA